MKQLPDVGQIQITETSCEYSLSKMYDITVLCQSFEQSWVARCNYASPAYIMKTRTVLGAVLRPLFKVGDFISKWRILQSTVFESH